MGSGVFLLLDISHCGGIRGCHLLGCFSGWGGLCIDLNRHVCISQGDLYRTALLSRRAHCTVCISECLLCAWIPRFQRSSWTLCWHIVGHCLSIVYQVFWTLRSFSITTLDVVLVIEFNSYQPEYESAVAVLFHVKRSEVTMDQGLLVTWCDLRGSFYWCGFILLHTGHSATSFSMSLFMAGQ